MSRGSRFLDEPTLYRHPETGQERTATTKVEAVQYQADGYRTAAVLDADDEHEKRVAAARKSAETRRKNARETGRKSTNETTEPSVESAIETTAPNAGADE